MLEYVGLLLQYTYTVVIFKKILIAFVRFSGSCYLDCNLPPAEKNTPYARCRRCLVLVILAI